MNTNQQKCPPTSLSRTRKRSKKLLESKIQQGEDLLTELSHQSSTPNGFWERYLDWEKNTRYQIQVIFNDQNVQYVETFDKAGTRVGGLNQQEIVKDYKRMINAQIAVLRTIIEDLPNINEEVSFCQRLKDFFSCLCTKSCCLLILALLFGISPNAWADCQVTNYTSVWLRGLGGNWSSDEDQWKLTKDDNNHYWGKFYVAASKDYYFRVSLAGSGWSAQKKGSNSYAYTSSATGNDYTDCFNDDSYNSHKITVKSATSGYVRLDVDWWGSYSWGSCLKIVQVDVSPLSGDMYPALNTVSSGSSLNMAPTLTGGSGSYNKQYSASPNIGSFDGDNYKAPMVLSNTSVTITLEVSDANGQLSGLAHKTITKQITITPPTGDLYIKHPWSTGEDGAWSWQKMEKVSAGNYRFSGNYGGTGKGCNINTTNSTDEEWRAKWFGNEDDGYYVNNSPATNDKCWFTLSYSDGTLTVAPKTYTLTLDGNGGMPETQDVTVTYGKPCPDFTAVQKTGYTWKGFFINTTGGSAVILKSTSKFNANTTNWITNYNWTKDANATLHAQWDANTYKVQFEKNGATSGSDHQQQSFTYDADEVALTSIESLGYGKTGYHFKGWATTSDGNVVYADQQQVKNLTAKAETIKVYAIWAPDTTVITLNRNYNRDGVDSNPGEYKAVYDATFTQFAKNTDFIREGYTFTGYKADINNSGSAGIINVVSGDPITYAFPQSGTYGKSGNVWGYTGSTLTAYAYWTANQYTITLHYQNETTPGTENKSVTFDAAATAVTKPSYGTNVFNGYYTQATGGVQVINADGAFVPNVDGYTSNGNWVKASDVDLYAQWTTRTACTITYGVTDGTQAVSTRGTIKAKIGSGEYSHTGSLAVYTGDVVTIEYSPKLGQYYTGNNGYEANGWFDAVSGGSSLPATHKNDYTFTVTGNASVYVKADPVVYTISTAVNPASTTQYPDGGAGTVTPTSGEAGPDVALQLTAAEKTGYDWVNWTLNDGTNGKIVAGTETDKTISVAAKAAGFTATANFSAHNYTITYHPNNGNEDFNEQYTIETAHTLAENPGRDNYTFDGWFDAETEGNKVTSIEQGSFGDMVLWARWSETKHAVTIDKGTGISSVTPFGEQQVGNVNPVEISATVATGYTWSQWTSTGNVTITEPSNISTSIKATGTGTVTATATEILLPLTTSVTESYMGSVDKTASSIGVVTSSQLTASSANRNYKFKQWHLTNCTITSGTVNDATITIKGDGVNNPSAEAEFEVAWLISGNDDISTGWGASGTKMTVVSDGVFKFEFNATKVASNDGDYNFKVYNTTRKAYYANTAGDGGWWFTRSAASAELAEGVKADKNMSLRSDMVGNYIFTLDCSTSRENPTLTVTFPTSTTYNVDIYYDGVTKTTVEGGAFTKSITANVPQSMRFDQWVVEGETTHVNIADVNSQTTTFTASGEGAIIRAKFKVVGVMYLKADGGVFGDAYVNFYSTDGYWSDDKGSGNKGNNCMSKNNHMTKIGKTDIYYLDVSGGIDKWTWEQAFSFVNKSVEHDNFSMCNVVYRSDYNDRLPLYVPRYGWITDYFIECHYYNDGIWMKYNDTYSGYKLWIREKDNEATAQSVMLTALTPGGYEFNTKLHLKSGTTYELKIYNENGEWYGVTNQTITASSCTNWHFWKGNNNCKLTASDEGDYTFTLNLGSGEVIISVQYPLAANDYRVIAKNGNDIVKYGDLIKNSGEAIQKDTVSFFNSNYTFRLQKYAGNDTWNEYGDEVTPTAEGAKEGVIDFIVTQDGNGNATLAYKGIYTGNYYIRTDGVDGGWGDYKNNSDNKMDNYGSLIVADPDYQYDVYKAKWVPSGKNVKFRVANDYSKAISDEFTTDDIIDNKETLPEGANVRFMWNSTTNELKRAYLSGSTDDEKRYLMLINTNSKMYDKTGEPQINELKFTDNNNWVYQADIQAKPGCEVKLTAQYNSKVQYFIGSKTTTRKIIDGSGDTKYTLRAVYDFKTNRLVAGWIPSGTIESNIILGSDMLIERTEQGDASQIVFGGDKQAEISISEIQHIYGVLKLTKTSMLNATETSYDKCIYWISFPFDVKVSEIFGVEKYGEVWAISNYRGDLRAQKGWFKQDTQTFWEFLKPSDIMKANVGYTLNLDPDYFNKESSEPWKNSAEEVAWYFPSIKENVGVVSLAQKDTTLPAQHCIIDREFETDGERTLNHKFTDSNWRVIGVPAFQNLEAPAFDPEPADDKEFGLKGFYEWIPATNTYTARPASGYTFKATGAYMVQYEGKITWSNAAVITTNKAPWHAPEYTYADAKNYSITLEFGNDDYTDQTFVTLIEKASTDFVLNEDMMKIDNAGVPNIYSFAGAYDVAYNETTFDNQTVMLGVSAPKDGSYTFAMPKDFSGKAVLVDFETGESTDLNLSNYTVELNKGTYNNRFQLVLEVEAKAPTTIDNAKGEWSVDGKTKKLFINDNIYLINAGRIYNVLGVGE